MLREFLRDGTLFDIDDGDYVCDVLKKIKNRTFSIDEDEYRQNIILGDDLHIDRPIIYSYKDFPVMQLSINTYNLSRRLKLSNKDELQICLSRFINYPINSIEDRSEDNFDICYANGLDIHIGLAYDNDKQYVVHAVTRSFQF